MLPDIIDFDDLIDDIDIFRTFFTTFWILGWRFSLFKSYGIHDVSISSAYITNSACNITGFAFILPRDINEIIINIYFYCSSRVVVLLSIIPTLHIRTGAVNCFFLDIRFLIVADPMCILKKKFEKYIQTDRNVMLG